jgi:hypothetical protein
MYRVDWLTDSESWSFIMVYEAADEAAYLFKNSNGSYHIHYTRLVSIKTN